MKHIIGIIIGAFLTLSVSVYAETKNPLEVVETLSYRRGMVHKLVDHDNGVACYWVYTGIYGSISCIKN